MRSMIVAMIAAVLMNIPAAQANTLIVQDRLSAEVSGYTANLRGEIGGWLSSCRYRKPEPFGPFMERVDWGDGSASVPEDFDEVSCGNISRHFYDQPGDYEVVVTRTSVGGANDELIFTEEIKATARVRPEITVDVSEDGSVSIGGQIGEWLSACDYPRKGRNFLSITVEWGDGTFAASCPETLSHRYEKPGHYEISIGVTAPGPTDGPVFSESRAEVAVPE